MKDPVGTTAPDPLGPPAHEQHWVDLVRDLAAGFAATAADHDANSTLPIENLRALHASGLDAALLPKEFGGQDLSYRSYGQITRLLSAACPSTACIWVMHIGAAVGLVTMSETDVARFYAEELIRGKRFANALSEPSGGNLFLMPQQHAIPVEGGYRLDGAKRFCSGCEVADHFLVNALVDGIPTFFGVAADESMSFVPIWDTMGLRASRSQLIDFQNTLLRGDRRCPPPSVRRPNHIGAGLAFLSLGVADAALDALIDHARSRTIPTTGAPLADMQWLRFALAEVHTDLVAAGTLAQHMCWLADVNDVDFIPATVRAKVLANRVAKGAAQLALEAGGGSAYLKTSPIERIFRDAQAGHLMAYSAEVCKGMIAEGLLGAPEGDRHG
ncbi:acyl-CoA dehydrogenase family protein [Amycolatopsis tolypomycina]|uniref:acyl-CoA dehydrogenase family protein n=1 Tax=Amycolatopsis tolypomycina TaxID=208445 RepID=UPI0033BCA832